MSLSTPNGGTLINREVGEERALELKKKAQALPRVQLDASQVSDLTMIANGALSPLQGFMVHEDHVSVVKNMRLANGHVMGLPVSLRVTDGLGGMLRPGAEVALTVESTILALLTVQDVFRFNKEEEARQVFGTTDPNHPGVARLMSQGDYLVGGPITLLQRPAPTFAAIEKDPVGVREASEALGWRTMVGFQTRNPIHRAHEYIQKCALEIVDGLLLHPLMGETKSDDVSAEVRLKSYKVMLDVYYPADRVLLAAFPAAMRYAGPREAVFHAICRRNYGCTHFIVGRDHAGVGNYYGTYDAQHIFSEFTASELGIQPLFFEHSFYCRACKQMATAKTCPHGEEAHISLSGTKVRAMLAAKQAPPPEITRPEVAEVLMGAQAAAAG